MSLDGVHSQNMRLQKKHVSALGSVQNKRLLPAVSLKKIKRDSSARNEENYTNLNVVMAKNKRILAEN